MSSHLAYYFAAFAVILTHNTIDQVKGQCTLQGCENGDLSNNIVAYIQQLCVDAIRQQQNEQNQYIHELFNASIQQLKKHLQDTVMTSLQAVDRRSHEQEVYIKQIQSVNELLNASFGQIKNLNASFQEMKNQQETITTSLQAIDRRSQEQDVYIKQVPSMHELINTTFQQMKNQNNTVMRSLQAIDRRSQEQDVYIRQVPSMHELINTTFQQMKNQYNTVMRSLQAIDRRSQEQDVYIKQVPIMHELINTTFQQMKNQNNTVMTRLQAVDRRSQEQDIYIKQVLSIHDLLNSSFQQMKDQHAAAMRCLDVIIQLLVYFDLSNKNRTHNAWKLATGLPVQLEVDLGDGPLLLPIVNNWIILMHRFDGSLSFNRTWSEYKNGFGDIGRGEFWLGNEIVHRLTNTSGSVYTIRIEVQLNANDRWYYADYATFSLDSENNKYALRLSGFSGNAGDSLTNISLSGAYNVGMSFSTWGADNDRSSRYCAQEYQAGWWFDGCFLSCLTCRYREYFAWHYTPGWQASGLLRAARMKIKSK